MVSTCRFLWQETYQMRLVWVRVLRETWHEEVGVVGKEKVGPGHASILYTITFNLGVFLSDATASGVRARALQMDLVASVYFHVRQTLMLHGDYL